LVYKKMVKGDKSVTNASFALTKISKFAKIYIR